MTTTTLDMWNANPNDLDDLLDRAALDLSRDVDADDLTNYILGVLAERVDVALDQLVRQRMTYDYMAVICLLDEADESSYDTLNQMAETLLNTIRAQGDQHGALKEIVKSELARRIRRPIAATGEMWADEVAMMGRSLT